MKAALLMTIEGKNIPAKPEFAKCFHEMTAVLGYPVQEVYVEDEVTLPDLDDVIAMMNGTKEVRDISYTTERPAQVTAVPAAAAPAEDDDSPSTPAGNFANLADNDRAELLKRMIRERLLSNLHPTPGCQDNEIRVGKIFDHWGTGLSRGSISRHTVRAVEQLESEGRSIYRGAGRYQLLRA